MRRVVFLAICAAALAMLVLPAAASAAGFVHLQSWGGAGTTDGRFNNIAYLATDAKGSVWVADWNNNRIERFTADGAFMSAFGGFGSGNGQLNYPTGIVYNEANDTLYVADSGNNRIEMFTRTGDYSGQFGGPGSGNSQFGNPLGLALDASGNLYVADFGNSRVQVFDATGAYLRQFGTPGAGNGQLNGPYSVAVDSTGDAFVADLVNNRVEVFDSSGAYLAQIGSLGAGDDQFNQPSGLAWDAGRGLLVTDYGNNRLVRLWWDGSALTWDQTYGTAGTGDGMFRGPLGLASAGDLIYVGEYSGKRVQKLAWDHTAPTVVVDNDHEWHSADYVVRFTASDDFAGFDHWLFFSSTFDFNPIGVQVSAFADHSLDGVNAVTLTAFDKVDNQVSNTTRLKIDTRPPVTTLTGAIDGYWSQTDVTLNFAASDRGAGVAHTYFTIDGGPATEPDDNGNATISSEGSFAVGYWSVDAAVPAGNIEATRSLTVNIDKTPPVPLATANVAVKRGRSATFKYSVTDNLSPTVMARILIFKKTKLAKAIYLSDLVPSATVLSKKARINLPIGKYTWMVESMDMAYNDALSAPKVLTVK